MQARSIVFERGQTHPQKKQNIKKSTTKNHGNPNPWGRSGAYTYYNFGFTVNFLIFTSIFHMLPKYWAWGEATP